MAALILLLLTHIWPWWLPIVDRDEHLWIPLAVGQLAFWPLFAALVGVRLCWPMTFLLAGIAAGYGMMWYCRWQFGFAGYGQDPAKVIEALIYFGAIGAVVALIVCAVCVRALSKAERTNASRPVVRVARSGALAGLTIASAVTLLLGVPWLFLASKWELINRGPTVGIVAVAGIVGLASASALWGTFLALARTPSRFSWRRTVFFAVTTSAVVVGLAAWFLAPFVRHHMACNSLAAAGVEIATWDGFWEARLGNKLEQLRIAREEPFWKRWYREYVPNIMSIGIDGKAVADDQLASLADIRGDHLQVVVHNPDPGNRILQELSTVRSIRYLDISFPAPEEDPVPIPGHLNDDAFAHIAALDNLTALTLFNVRFSPNGLKRLVGKVELEILRFDFCDVRDETVSVLGEFENLVSLVLTGTQVTDSGLQPLGRLKKLEILRLDLSHVRGDGLLYLANLPLLETLGLQGCPIRDDALKLLARAPLLRELDLRSTQVAGRGLAYLDRASSLEQINLEGAAIDDAGFMSAAGLPWRVKLVLGDMRTVSPRGILQMHQERARLSVLPAGATFAVEDEDAELLLHAENEGDEVVEPFDQWLEEAGGSEDEAEVEDENAVLVDAEMEVDHNTIILFQYGVSDALVEEYRRDVLGEPAATNDEAGDHEMEAPDEAAVNDDFIFHGDRYAFQPTK